jgi:hypothetical protein
LLLELLHRFKSCLGDKKFINRFLVTKLTKSQIRIVKKVATDMTAIFREIYGEKVVQTYIAKTLRIMEPGV